MTATSPSPNILKFVVDAFSCSIFRIFFHKNNFSVEFHRCIILLYIGSKSSLDLFNFDSNISSYKAEIIEYRKIPIFFDNIIFFSMVLIEKHSEPVQILFS